MFKGGAARFSVQVKRFITFLLLISSVVALVSFVNQEAFMRRVEMSQDEYQRGQMKAFTTGRSKIWKTATLFFFENPLLGLGLGSFPKMYSLQTGEIPKAAHNEYLSTLADRGIIGLVLLSIWVFGFGWTAWRLKTMRHVAIAWWLTFALVIGGHDLWRGKDFWLPMAFIAVLARTIASKVHSTVPSAVSTRPGSMISPRLPKVSRR